MNESDPRSDVHYLGSSEFILIPYRPEIFFRPYFHYYHFHS